MKKYTTLPIDRLVSDVPVDPVHARELADSIKATGQLAPIIVRDETMEVIDGFHRIAAMKELGFNRVECVVTLCDADSFWDFRIMSASLHKAVTFARAVDWIEEIFKISPWNTRYKSAYSLFHQVSVGEAPQEVRQWATNKSQRWGLATATIENWLYTKESLAEDILVEAKSLPYKGRELTQSHYQATAESLPKRPELQRQILEKAKREQLAPPQIRTVAQALRQAEDEEEIQSILRQPVSRTEDQIVREAKIEKLLSQPRKQVYVPLPEGRYRTIVIDPPWPIEKILREVRPNQVLLDYPTMTVEEIEALPVPELAYEDGCHIYLWTTHKYLPRAFKVLDTWGANYECLLTWVKNVGITPFSWMYSTEHCLFARIGNLPLLKLGKRLDFQAKVREHSRKPDEFYNLVKEVSPEPRIDMFSREKREGFTQYGNELDRFKQMSVID